MSNRVVKTLHKISKKQPRTPHDTLHCVHMRIRQVRKFEEYCHSKSKSFSPLTRPTSEAEALLIEPDDFPDLLSSDTDEDESNSDIQDIGNTLQENNKLQTVAHFIADSRTQIYENIPKDLLDAASSTNKILIDNLPPRLPEDEFQKIFHRFGGALFSHTYTSRLFEVGQHQMLPSDISDLNKGAKRWSQVQKVESWQLFLIQFRRLNQTLMLSSSSPLKVI